MLLNLSIITPFNPITYTMYTRQRYFILRNGL